MKSDPFVDLRRPSTPAHRETKAFRSQVAGAVQPYTAVPCLTRPRPSKKTGTLTMKLAHRRVISFQPNSKRPAIKRGLILVHGRRAHGYTPDIYTIRVTSALGERLSNTPSVARKQHWNRRVSATQTIFPCIS